MTRSRGTLRWLTCCVCGADAGRFEQHWNRDDFFGICVRCVMWERTRLEEEEITRLYGVQGVNFAAPVDQPEVSAP